MTGRSAPPRMPVDEDPPFSAPQEWHAEMARENEDSMTSDYTYRGSGRSLSPGEASAAIRNGRAPQPATPALKGAVKVTAFPSPSPYPFAQIAGDGGIWKLDPAEFRWRGKPVKAVSVRQAALAWGSKEGYSVKTVIDGGHVFVQFTAKAGGR